MGGHHGEVQLDQDGRAGGGHDAVVGGGGHAHAQHDAAHHGQHQTDDGGVASQLHDGVDEDGGQTGDGDAAGDDARHAAGHGHSDRAAGTGFQRLHRGEEGALAGGGQRLAGRLGLLAVRAALALQEEVHRAHHDGGQNGIGRGVGHSLAAGGHQPHQQDQGDDQVAVAGQHAPLGQLLPGNALQTQLLRLQMDGDKNTGEVQDGGQDGLDGHLGVGQLHVLRHQEGGSAHDGGHDLTAGGGGRLYRAGELGLIAGLLHHGDGERAGGHGVAHGRAGHHAAQGGGDDGHLGRAAAGPAGQPVGEADEEVGDAGALQERAENDEQNDVGVAHADRRADDAGGGVEQLVDDGLEGVIQRGGIHRAGVAQLVDERVHDQCTRHAQDRHAHAAAAQLHQDQDADNADDHMDRLDTGGQADQRHGVQREVEEAGRAHHHQHQIVPGQVVHPDVVLAGGVGQETDDDDAAHEHGEPDLGHGLGKQGHADAEQAERRHEDADDQLGRTLPQAGSGFAVIFAHDLVQIRALVSGGVGLRRRAGIRLFLVDAHSYFSPKNCSKTARTTAENPP